MNSLFKSFVCVIAFSIATFANAQLSEQHMHGSSCNHSNNLSAEDFQGDFDLSSHTVNDIRAAISRYLKREIILESLDMNVNWKSNSNEIRDMVTFIAHQRSEFLTLLSEDIQSGRVSNRGAAEELFSGFIAVLKNQLISGDYPKSEPTPQNTSRVVDGPCVNADFEEGTTNAWELYTGRNYDDAIYSFTDQTAVGPGAYHQIMNAGQMDPVIAGLPAVNPDGGSHSIRIGNGAISSGGGGLFSDYYGDAAMIRQTFLVTPQNAVFTFSYAVVLESPAGHSGTEYPYFVLKVFDENGVEAECGNYEVNSGSGGSTDFIVGGQNGSGEDILYIPWTTAFSPLDNYIGQNVTVEFYAADCSQSGHYGYAYVDASCNSAEVTASNDFICGTDPVTLTGPPNASTYTWNTGESTEEIVVNAPGTYDVTVVPVQGAQCSINLSIDIDGAPNPVADLDADPLEVCAFSEIDFNTSGSSAPVGYTLENYIWDFGNGIVSPPGSGTINDGDLTNTTGSFDAPSHTFDTPGNYSVSVTVITEAGCQDQATIDIEVVDAPIIDAGQDVTLCEGETYTPQAQGGINYSWDGGLTDGQEVTLDPGVNTFTVTGYNATGCPNTDDVTINVEAAPTVDAGVDQAICIGEDVTLSASGASGYIWSDNVQDGVPFAPTQTATYTVTVSSPNGCEGSDDVTVTVNNLPNIGANSPSACEASTVTLNGTGGVAYTWNNGVENGVPFVPVSGTTYTVTGEDANGCVNTFDVTVTTSTYPTASFSATPTSGQPPLEVTITNNSQGDITDYSWDFGNGNTSDQDFDQISQGYIEAGNPTIVLIVSNNGCNDTMMITLDLEFAPFSFDIPNVFTPNGDGANDYFELSLENVAEFEFYIFNRWGNLMAEIRDVNTLGWDGTTPGGSEAPDGVYFHRYKIVGFDGQVAEGHGFLHLVRD